MNAIKNVLCGTMSWMGNILDRERESGREKTFDMERPQTDLNKGK